MRQDQNLKDLELLGPLVDMDVQVEWDRYSAVLQPAHKQHRPKRIDRCTLEKIVYKFEYFAEGDRGPFEDRIEHAGVEHVCGI